MITPVEISLLLIAHFIGDFILQTDAMAKGKSSSNQCLLYHVSAYLLPFLALLVFIPIPPLFLIVNGAAHFATDYVSSRMTKKFWAEGKVHEFFVVIGADQLVHALTLIWTYEVMWHMMVW